MAVEEAAEESTQPPVAPLMHPIKKLNNGRRKCRQDEALDTTAQIFTLTRPGRQFQVATIVVCSLTNIHSV